VLVEADVGVLDLHPLVLVRDALDALSDVLPTDRIEQFDVRDLDVHVLLLGVGQRAEDVRFRDDAGDGPVVAGRGRDQPVVVVFEHPPDCGLDRLVGARRLDGAAHHVVHREVEDAVDVAGAVAFLLAFHAPDGEVGDVVGGHDAREVPVLVVDRDPRDTVFAQQPDDASDGRVLVDSDDVLGVDPGDVERVEVLEYGLEDVVPRDDAREFVTLEHGCDLRPALDEHPRDLPNVIGQVDARSRADQSAHLGAVLDVRLDQLSLGDDSLVVPVDCHDDTGRAVALEHRADFPQALVGVYRLVVAGGDVGNIHRNSQLGSSVPGLIKVGSGFRSGVSTPKAEPVPNATTYTCSSPIVVPSGSSSSPKRDNL
jgi:hypothetical protein